MKHILLVSFLASVFLAQSQRKIEYVEYDLDNGIHVILHEEHATPIVAVSVLYHVGSKNEKAITSFPNNQILTNDLDQKSNGFIQQARGQQVINSVFSLVADSLYRVATVNPSFSSSVLEKKNETQRNLERSLTYLTERDRVSSVSQLRVAMGGVNELASILVSILEQSDNNSDGEGGGENLVCEFHT